MEFKITEQFKINTKPNHLEDVKFDSKIFIPDNETVLFRINKFSKLGYKNVPESLVDVLNIDKFYFGLK